MYRLLLPFLLLAALVAAAVVTDRPLPRADFTFVNRGDVSTLDLQRMSWMQDMRAAKVLFEGLVKNNVLTWDYPIIPGVAERWEVSEDGRRYTFHLRADAKWSNGRPVVASDFVYSWRRALLPETSSDYTGLFQLIKGGRPFFEWRTAALAEYAARPIAERTAEAAAELWARTLAEFDQSVGLRALDDRTLEVELESPVPYFLDLCAMPPFYPVYPPIVRAYESLDPGTGRQDSQRDWTKPGVLVSNGPFILSEWRFKRDMRFAKSEHYWGRDSVNIDTISSPSIEDPNAALLAYNSGSVDWISDVTVPYRGDVLAEKMKFYEEHRAEYEALKAHGLDQFEIDRRLPADSRKNIHAIPTFGTYWYNFNCLPKLRDGRANPFHDPRVRRAFAMATDKKAIVDQVMRIGNPIASTIIPPGSLGGYHSPRGVPYDPAAARALLAEAGYPGGQGMVTVEILFNKDAGHDKIAQVIARSWEENLGIKTLLQMKEVKVYKDDLQNANYMVSRAGWYGDYADATTFLDLLRSWDGNNDRKYNNPVYDRLLADAALSSDPEARLRLLEEAERIIMDEDLPMIPLFQYVTLYMFDPQKVAGLNCHPRTDQNLFLIDMLGDGKGRDLPRPMSAREPGATGGWR
jgi:oligopeptide transport system substrate-binding protein